MKDKDYIDEIKKWHKEESVKIMPEPGVMFALKQIQWLLDYIEDMELPKTKKKWWRRR